MRLEGMGSIEDDEDLSEDGKRVLDVGKGKLVGGRRRASLRRGCDTLDISNDRCGTQQR